MVNYTKLTEDEIRELIVEDSGGLISLEQTQEVKGKVKLKHLHKSLVEVVGEEDEDEQEQVIEEKSIPSYSSPEWPEYVMSHFTKDELAGENPKASGLRRVAGLLLGPIIESGPTQAWVNVNGDGPSKAACIYEVRIEWLLDGGGHLRTFRGMGGSYIGNTDDEYAIFPEAMSETRAEVRALKKALGLSQVCAEEITKKDLADSIDDEDMIQSTQINIINKIAERLSIDVEKFINTFKAGKTYSSINEVSREMGANMIFKLNQYQSSDDNSIEVPEEIKL